jgi:hypothetical protein
MFRFQCDHPWGFFVNPTGKRKSVDDGSHATGNPLPISPPKMISHLIYQVINHDVQDLKAFTMKDVATVTHNIRDNAQSEVFIQGGSNKTGTNCDLFTHSQSRSYLNHLVFVLPPEVPKL